MLKSSAGPAIRLRGVRHNNLKNFDLDLPLNRLIVITGLSGSGKSSLAFDTLFAEGQRRYIETFSPYARQFFDRMDKPQVDSIEGIPPAIAIEQRNAVRTTRSTVGTMTEICDYMKTLWPHLAQLHCRQCGRPVRKDSPQSIWSHVLGREELSASELLITFDLPLSEKLSLDESLALISKQGYQRLLFESRILRLDEAASIFAPAPGKKAKRAVNVSTLTVIQDRLKVSPANRARFVEACEQAYHFGKGKLALRELDAELGVRAVHLFSNRLHCAECDIEYGNPSPALFSFNNPVGACPACRGFGRIISIDYNLALPDRSRTLAQGVVKPWRTGHGVECQRDMMRMCRQTEIPTDVPFERLPKKAQALIIEGEPDYGKDEEHEWPRAWYGVKGYFRWLESKAYKMHVRVLLSRYRAYTTCPECRGKRLRPEALLYRASLGLSPQNPSSAITLSDFYQLPIRDSLKFIEGLVALPQFRSKSELGFVLNEVGSRLSYLEAVGLGYLTLDRPTRSLSGGETERVNLTTCLGTRLVNTLFVLDEPSVGLHPRDTVRLVRILQRLRNAGNTVVVVEHEASVMRAADQIVDLGPGHGATGGNVVFQGRYSDISKSARSLTGQYLSGRKRIPIPRRRPVGPNRSSSRFVYPEMSGSESAILNDAAAIQSPGIDQPTYGDRRTPNRGATQSAATLQLSGITRHNLNNVSVQIPLNRFVCITGVSGSGKTTLVREALLPAIAAKLKSEAPVDKASDRLTSEETDNGEDAADDEVRSVAIEGWEHLRKVVLVDQSILAKTPRSNPAVYIGAFDDMRELFSQSAAAKRRGLNASAFSFNSSQGQCERCRGAGFEKIEMQFLSDVFVRCPDCNGRRYRSHILEIKVAPADTTSVRALSIGDLLDSTVDEAIDFLSAFRDSRHAQRAAKSLGLLQEAGLGYLSLGQPINTLSGGESQRLKLVRHLADAAANEPAEPTADRPPSTLFLFDEPTTGLHFDDVGILLNVFQRLVNAGHSVVVIEHNVEMIKSADWVIDLGPDAGDEGGQIVATGTPEDIAACPESHTGNALREVLGINETRSLEPKTMLAAGLRH